MQFPTLCIQMAFATPAPINESLVCGAQSCSVDNPARRDAEPVAEAPVMAVVAKRVQEPTVETNFVKSLWFVYLQLQ
ncbi:UNVERIFIED_CONTAM: hypothetical protein HDU68_006556 [Siphonaria sp. JEL0065]|nr:hypothetical protein HDU68_006556 [Siphonaria sp. JEL0065]